MHDPGMAFIVACLSVWAIVTALFGQEAGAFAGLIAGIAAGIWAAQ